MNHQVSVPVVPVVEPQNMYPINSIRVLMGWETDSAWREARRRGLNEKIRTIGKRSYLLGRDCIDFVMQEGQERESMKPAQN